ncbi:MAG: hypothetical protein WC505_02545 [Patescibacteria group bacterium]
MLDSESLFNKGDKAPVNAVYVCVPCGYRKTYKTGETFSECTSCLAGTDQGDREYMEGTSLWEKAAHVEE